MFRIEFAFKKILIAYLDYEVWCKDQKDDKRFRVVIWELNEFVRLVVLEVMQTGCDGICLYHSLCCHMSLCPIIFYVKMIDILFKGQSLCGDSKGLYKCWR